jgi:hypothetical protein
MHSSAAHLQALVQATMLAASSHNTQPWLFEINGDGVDLLADRTRALPVNDAEDRESEGDTPRDWLAAGLALQRLLLVGVRQGPQASYLNQPVQVAALRPTLQQPTERPGHAQLLLRIGGPTKALPAAPRRPLANVLELA